MFTLHAETTGTGTKKKIPGWVPIPFPVGLLVALTSSTGCKQVCKAWVPQGLKMSWASLCIWVFKG